jgi:protein ImuA
MTTSKQDIISRLKKEILPLEGYKPDRHSADVGLHMLTESFPGGVFPQGAVHEFICNAENAAATSGFIAGTIAALMRHSGATIWIGHALTLYPPSLKYFATVPDNIIFIDVPRQRDILWVMEEVLKYEGLAAVVAEVRDLDFISSRKLQLAVEHSRVTGFIIRKDARQINTTACIARWKITHLPSQLPDDMPGVGFPRWQVELLKIRHGKPGCWQLEWKSGRFSAITLLRAIAGKEQRKTG